MTGILEILSGALQGRRITVEGFPFLIGRAPGCRLRFDPVADAQASSRHAQIELLDGQYWIVDLNSSNGTFINNQRATRQILSSGDVVSFGLQGPTARFLLEADSPIEVKDAKPVRGPTAASPQGIPETQLGAPIQPAKGFFPKTTCPRSAETSRPEGGGPSAMRQEMVPWERPVSDRTPVVEPGEVTISVEWEGQTRTHTFSSGMIRIGRHPANDITFDAAKASIVSANHAKLTFLDGKWTLVDLESTNGVFLRAGPGRLQKVVVIHLTGGEEFELGRNGPTLRFEVRARPRQEVVEIEPATVVLGMQGVQAMAEREQVQHGEIPLTNEMTIGRQGDCAIQLTDPQVSQKHARLFLKTGAYYIEDLGSRNGTYVNGQRTSQAKLSTGDSILIGGRKLVFSPQKLALFDFAKTPGLECFGLSRIAEGKTLLDNIWLSIQVGEFAAILGPSGCGKSTLMKALNGYRAAEVGRVQVVQTDLYADAEAVRSFIGYVPQDDAIHTNLTVVDTLEYAARLRLPPDFSEGERRERVERVMSDLELLDHQNKFVYQLSGGQRKRVSIGVELLTDPRVLFLDEPTSGLDPGMEYNMMRIAREIACAGRTVVLTTHAMTNITLCDRLIFLVRGKLAFFGAPKQALHHFNVSRYESLFEVYKEKQPEEWKEIYRSSPACRKLLPAYAESKPAPAAATSTGLLEPRSSGPLESFRQMWVLLCRYTTLSLADPWNLFTLLVVSPGVIGLGFLAITDMPMVLLMLSVSTYWLACQNASKEVVKELAIYKRERMVNLGVVPYILSKLGLLTVIALAQAAILLGLVIVFKGYTWDIRQIYPVLLWTSISGVTIGVLISAGARTMDQAQTAVPILLICQVVLSGAFQDEVRPSPAAAKIYSCVTTYWSFDELKRVCSRRENQTRAQVEAQIKKLEDRQNRLKDEMDRVESRRVEVERELNGQISGTQGKLEEARETKSAQTPQEMKDAQQRVKDRLSEAKSGMEQVDKSRTELSSIADQIKMVGEERQSLGDDLKALYKKKYKALWFNHLGTEADNLPWMRVLIAASLLISFVLLKLQDYREIGG